MWITLAFSNETCQGQIQMFGGVSQKKRTFVTTLTKVGSIHFVRALLKPGIALLVLSRAQMKSQTGLEKEIDNYHESKCCSCEYLYQYIDPRL